MHTQVLYFGLHKMDLSKDLKQRKAAAWTVCNKLNKTLPSNLNANIKVNIFKRIGIQWSEHAVLDLESKFENPPCVPT